MSRSVNRPMVGLKLMANTVAWRLQPILPGRPMTSIPHAVLRL